MLCKTLPVLALIMASFSGRAQVATGTYPYGTFDSKGPETINVGNLNMHLSLPVINKPGRGLPFYYNLNYDSSVWGLASTNGTLSWNPSLTFGWSGDTEAATGYISYSKVVTKTTNPPQPGTCTTTTYQNWTYHDSFGVAHPFSNATYSVGGADWCNADYYPNDTETATDGSGYTLSVTNYTMTQLTSSAGVALNVPVNNNKGAGTVSDLNGNQVTTDGNGNFTDTLGKKALVIAGSAPSNKTFTYVDASGNNQTVTVAYKQYTVQTAFGCSGVGEYGPVTNPLVDSVSFPDGSAYHFAYETTPGASSSVTGRLASLTLRTGGVIQYSYSGGSHGIVCSDGSSAGVTRSLAATGGSVAATTTYARTVNTGAFTSHTDVTDGLGNHSGYDFVLPGNTPAFVAAMYYETNRTAYQGSASGTLLLARSTCYDGNASPCVSTRFNLPVSQIDTYEALNSGGLHGSTAKYNTYGLQTEQDIYDYGTSSARGALLRNEVWSYPSSGVVSLVSYDSITDNAGHQISLTNYAYDETSGTGHAAVASTSGLPQHGGSVGPQRGNLTTTTQWNNLGTAVTTTSAYEDTGNALTTATPNGSWSFAYDSGTHAFTTTSTPPRPYSGVSLPTNASFDANSGLPLTATDPNNAQVAVKTYDALLRPTEIDAVDSGGSVVGKTTFTYVSPNVSSQETFQNASGGGYTYTDMDAYGRADRVAVSNGQGSNQWYQQDSCFDANGRLQFQAYPYQGSGLSGSKVCSGAGDTTAYDALGRVVSVTHSDNTSVHFTYTGRATKVADENGVTRVSQIDGLGRVISVCEVSAATQQGVGPVNCGQDIAATGFLTTYAYSTDGSSNQVTTITQGAQTRTFMSDSLGRTVSVTEPERGTTTYAYTYNSTGLLVTRKRPKANQTSTSTLTTTTTQYDSLGRTLSVGYDDSLTPTKAYSYDTTNWAEAGSQKNVKGRLSLLATFNGSSLNSGTLYSYDATGRATDTWQCNPTGCGNSAYDKHTAYTYDWAGNLTSEFDPGAGNVAYGRSLAGEITSITNQTFTLSGGAGSATLASNYQNGVDGAVSYTYGNGLSQFNLYDSLGRLEAGWVCIGAPSQACSNQRNGFYVHWSGTRATDSGENYVGQGIGYQYDDFNRLKGTTNSSGQATYSYVYDRYGNRWQQNALQGGPSFSQSFNAATNQLNSGGYTYDAAGNMTYDATTSHHFTYDAEGNQLQVDSGSTATFIYDALNHSVYQSIGGQVTESIYDLSGRMSSAWTSHTVLSESHIFADGIQLAYRTPDGNTYFKHTNWMKTDRVHTDLNGATAATFTSLPWGDGGSINASESYGSWDFARYADLDDNYEDGTYHAQYRFYSPAQGHWMSPDPYDGSYDPTNPQSFNRYSYVLNNPLSLIDPSGLDCDDDNGTLAPNGNIDGGCYPPEPWQCMEYGNCPGQGGAGSGGGGLNGYTCVAANGSTYPCAPTPPPAPLPPIAPNNAPQPINWKKVGSCLVDSTLKHYGLDALTAGSGALAIPISKSLVPPFRMIGEPTTNLLSVLGHYVEINVPRITIDGLASTNLLRIAGRANPYVAGALLAIDVGMISYDTYQCYQKQ